MGAVLERPVVEKSFFGREKELTELSDIFKKPDCNLLTITGIGGVGKTALAQQFAEKMQPFFSGGMCFVSLADLEHSGQLASSIAVKLGLNVAEGNTSTHLLEVLKRRKILLVLDNFEHIIKASTLVEKIIRTSKFVKIIVTSRTRLAIPGEFIYQLSGMEVPASGEVECLFSSPPVQLFLSNMKSDIVFDLEDLKTVVKICQAVYYIPLAIKLASSWLDTLTPAQILENISSGAELLFKKNNLLDDRHSCFENVFNYSWIHISKEERLAFADVSIFKNRFSLAAAVFITGRAQAIFFSLVDKSLLQLHSDGYFSLHPLLHIFSQVKAEELLGRVEVLTDKHAEYYCNFLDDSFIPASNSFSSSEAMNIFIENLTEIRIALSNALKFKKRSYVIIAGTTFKQYFIRMGAFEEGKNFFDAAFELLKNTDKEKAISMFLAKATFVIEQTHYDDAVLIINKVQRNSTNLDDLAYSEYLLGKIYLRTANLQKSEVRMNNALRIAREAGNKHLEAIALGGLGDYYNHSIQIEEAVYFLKQAVKLNEQINDERALFSNYITLSDLMYNNKLGEQAMEYASRALVFAKSLQGDLYIALAFLTKACALKVLNQLPSALKNVDKSIYLFESIYSVWGMQSAYKTKASIELAQRRLPEATESIQTCLKLSELIGATYNSMESYITAGDIFTELSDFDKAEKIFQKAKKIATHLALDVLITQIEEKISNLK